MPPLDKQTHSLQMMIAVVNYAPPLQLLSSFFSEKRMKIVDCLHLQEEFVVLLARLFGGWKENGWIRSEGINQIQIDQVVYLKGASAFRVWLIVFGEFEQMRWVCFDGEMCQVFKKGAGHKWSHFLNYFWHPLLSSVTKSHIFSFFYSLLSLCT